MLIFFANEYQKLPIVLQKHYCHNQFTNRNIICNGKMQIKFGNFFKIFLFFFHILKILIPKQGKSIATVVYLKSKINSSYLFLERNFFFKQKEIKFFSYMIPQENNKVIEVMNYNICWKFQYNFINDKITLTHCGYYLKIFNFFLLLPIEYLFGKISAEEKPISENKFFMKMKINHPIFGYIYCYQGIFTIQ